MSDALSTAVRAAAVLASQPPTAPTAVAVADAVRAARDFAATLQPAAAPPVDVMAAARAAAAAAAASLGGAASAASASGSSSGTGAGAPPVDAEAAKRAAAAAFAQSLGKKPRWGDGSAALVNAPPVDPGKQRQAMVVSQLQDKLAAFRKDRGVEAPAEPGAKLSLKLFVPEKTPEMRFERNWVGIFIGRDGVNKKRFEEEVPGVRIFVRGEGTQLRGMTKQKEDDVEAMHVYLEADNQDALDRARVRVLTVLNPKHESSALTLFDEAQITTMALEKTTDKEACAFCGKPGHHHSKCPTRTTKFDFKLIVCAVCGCGGHTARDCKGDRSKIASAAQTRGPAPSVFEDSDFAAFEAELLRRSGS